VSDSDLQLGVLGVTEGNGHPYSFSAIVNGYSPDGFAEAGWEGILAYLEERDPAEFGFPGVAVSHAWTQEPAETERLCAAARIPNAVRDRTELLDAEIDGVLLLRDDHENHRPFAEPFLEAGLQVFVDKPLTLAPEDLAYFEPYLRSGQLMSCSGLRYARELDGPRRDLNAYGDLRVIRGTVLFDWAHYGVHVLEAILNVVDARPVAVRPGPAAHQSLVIETDSEYPVQIDALGEAPLTFDVDIYGSAQASRHRLSDNFTAFRRTLWRFIEGVRTGDPQIPPEETLAVVRTLIAGQRAQGEDRKVTLTEVGN
jgi:predicted dehydrogenase